MAQIVPPQPAEHHAGFTEQAGGRDILAHGPARRTVGLGVLQLARPMHGHRDGDDEAGDAARGRDERAGDEYPRRIGVEDEPPDEEGIGWIDRPAGDHEPGRAQFRLVAERRGGPLGRAPCRGERDRGDGDELAPLDLGGGHAAEIVAGLPEVQVKNRPRELWRRNTGSSVVQFARANRQSFEIYSLSLSKRPCDMRWA